MPTDKFGGAHAYVTGTMRLTNSLPFIPTSTTSTTPSKLSTALHSILGSSNNSSSVSPPPPPPAYHAIYPPSPPASPPTLASSGASIRSTTSSTKSSYINPLQQALASPSTPIKPLLTPRSSHDGPSSDNDQENSNILSTIFPSSSPLHQLPATKVELTDLVPTWSGAVLENPGMGTRTLYVEGGAYEDVNMRESVCGVLEMAEEKLGCTGVVMVLEKNSADISELIHQLLYVGGTITSSPFAPNPAYILVALDLM